MKELSNELGYTINKIKEILINNNIRIRQGRQRKTFLEEDINKIKEMAQQHYSYQDIADELHCGVYALRAFMKENGITKNKAKKINHFLKEDYFKNIDSEAKAYFLGLMKTDGYVKNYKGDSYTIGISLKESDKEILEKFKQELNLSSSLYHDKRPKKEAYVLEFTSEQMAKDLKYFDIIPKKTYFLDDIHLELIPKEFQRHYLRGLLDGDGAVFKEKTQIVVSFCGYSQNFVRSFQKAINNAIQYEYSGAIIKTNAWQCKWKGNKLAEKILSYLYEDSSFYLTRKKQFYDLLK